MVNLSLAESFIKQGEEVFIYSVRKGSTQTQTVEYPKEIHTKLINTKQIWSCPRYQEAIAVLKKGHILQGVKKIYQRIQYDADLKKDYSILGQEIETIEPDIIINSHYELLQGIPPQYLSRTINHYHTSFLQLLEHQAQLQFLKKYQSKIAKYVWLTEESCKLAKENGLHNSITIYNPIRFSSEARSDVKNNKTAIFLGRISEEKRLELAIDIFIDVVQKNNITDWNFKIYAIGELEGSLKEKIEKCPFITFMGRTDNPKEVLLQAGIMLLTSQFEGFPLTVLEANECGVPVISFDFGETAKEVIKEDTGILVKQNDIMEYEKQLCILMKQEETREQLSKQAKEFAKQFTIQEIQKKWNDLWMEIHKKNEK